MNKNAKINHTPVLESEVVEQFTYLKSCVSPLFFDGTLGAGGHSIAIAQNTLSSNNEARFIGVDQDQKALQIAKKNIKNAKLNDKFILIHDNFKNVDNILDEQGIDKIDGALLDIGVSSMQLDDAERGFSFKDPFQLLDMRMNQDDKIDAKYILNNYRESEIEQILRDYGEEPFARRIARGVVEMRKIKRVDKVKDLLEVLDLAIPTKFKFGKTHYATRTFQALRIEVNHELEILDDTLFYIMGRMNIGGKLAVITFHSLEDRIVKRAFQLMQNPCQCPPRMPCICGKEPIGKIITKKPIIATEAETELNKRSRSAKLRVIEKL